MRVLAGPGAVRAHSARGTRWGGSRKGRRIQVTALTEAAVKRLDLQGMKIARIAHKVGLRRPTIYRLREVAVPAPRKRARLGPAT